MSPLHVLKIAFMALAALIGAHFAAAPASAQTTKYDIETTVIGPPADGRFGWDGRMIYLAPVEFSNISPPDLELCVFTRTGHTCYRRRFEDGETASLCPDSPTCRFEVSLPIASVVGLVVFDIDENDMLKEGAKATTGILQQTTHPSDDWLGQASRMAMEQARNAAAWMQRSGAAAEWVDALILADDRRSPDVAAIAANIRKVVSDRAGSDLDLKKHRIAGPIAVRARDECEWPAPVCTTTYLAISLQTPGPVETTQ